MSPKTQMLASRLSELYHSLKVTIERHGYAEITPEWVHQAFEGQIHHHPMYIPMEPSWPEPGNPQKDFKEWLPIQGFRLVDRPDQLNYRIERLHG